jgi:plastocyanin
VKEGLGNHTFAIPSDPVVLDQSGCKYHPHVLGVMAGQTVKIANSDPTTHNIHPTPKDNREWNESQAPQAPALDKTFAREEIMVPVKCNQHPWMRMFINVVKNPFFAVSGPDGKFDRHGRTDKKALFLAGAWRGLEAPGKASQRDSYTFLINNGRSNINWQNWLRKQFWGPPVLLLTAILASMSNLFFFIFKSLNNISRLDFRFYPMYVTGQTVNAHSV